MKCRSVACIWSGTPPSHRVTAAAALSHPPTLYTGGSDGSIIWWNLHASDSNLEIVPMAMLCGHAAPIADLGICDPLVVSGSEERDSLGDGDGDGDGEVSSSPHSHGALISACADGMLCVWSRSSGHCRRRRKLPPWVGSPSMVRTLPSNPRYVCIACCFVDSVHLLDHHSVESSEAGEVLGDRESQHKKPPKCTVVIVDSYTLSIVQTVFHGNLSIGSLTFMDVVSLTEDQEKHAVVMADSFGRLQLVSIPKNSHQDKEGGTGLHPSSQLEMTVCAEGLSEGGNVMSIATCGNVIAFVLKSHCIFRLLPSGNTIGEISSVDDLLCEKSNSTQSHMVGGLFVEIENVGNLPNTQESDEFFSRNFAVWNNKGLSIVYSISYSKGMFKCESLCEIPADTHPLDVRLSISFIQMGHYILRIESLCFDAEEPLQWKPHVTIWSACQKHDDHGNLRLWFKLHGVGCSLVDWTANSTPSNESECPGDMETKLTSSKSFVSSSGSVNGYDNDNLGLVNKRGVVSSSMVISETFFAPYAVVYGFFTGEIEIVRFDLFEGLSSLGGSSHHEVKPQISRQFFLGHTGAVLCLAAHRMVGIAKGWSFNQVLVSGSMDCTVRIWDLDTGNLITVMHQHVGPVRQIILSPAHTYRPWSDCFLSVGEDSCVALASLETLRVERIFPGHPSYPAKVVWDGGRGYIACLCQNHSGTSDAVDILYIWDVKTGARERVLRGTGTNPLLSQTNQAKQQFSNDSNSQTFSATKQKNQSIFPMSIIPNFRRGSVFDPFSLDVWDPFKDFPFPSSSSLSTFPEFSRENSAFLNTRIDWKETPEAHLFKADLPGLKKEEVKVEVEDDRVLQISGERNVEKEDKNDKWHRVERSSGKFLRRFQLPENAKVGEIKAAMENGVLSVTVPKAEVKKADVKAIEISG